MASLERPVVEVLRRGSIRPGVGQHDRRIERERDHLATGGAARGHRGPQLVHRPIGGLLLAGPGHVTTDRVGHPRGEGPLIGRRTGRSGVPGRQTRLGRVPGPEQVLDPLGGVLRQPLRPDRGVHSAHRLRPQLLARRPCPVVTAAHERDLHADPAPDLVQRTNLRLATITQMDEPVELATLIALELTHVAVVVVMQFV